MKDRGRWVSNFAIAALDIWIAAWMFRHGAPIQALVILATGALVIWISSLFARLE
jgi:hypothetical protein